MAEHRKKIPVGAEEFPAVKIFSWCARDEVPSRTDPTLPQ